MSNFDNTELLAKMSAAAQAGTPGLETHPDYQPRIECRIHGGWWHMPLIRVEGRTAIVQNLNGQPLALTIQLRQRMHLYENCASAEDIANRPGQISQNTSEGR